LNNYQKYIEADKALSARNFSAYFDLCAKNAFLKETQTYKKTLMFGEQLVAKMQKLESEEIYREALQMAQILSGFTPYASMAIEKVSQLSDLVAFLDVVDNAIFGDDDAIKTCYELAATNPKFQSTREFQILLKRFADVADIALLRAKEGKSGEALAVLAPYLEVAYWSNKIKDIMKTAYFTEITKAAQTGQKVDWSVAFENYIALFGKDVELENIAEKIKELSIFKAISSGRMAMASISYPYSIFQPQ
jgi:hypothetical protein